MLSNNNTNLNLSFHPPNPCLKNNKYSDDTATATTSNNTIW